MKKEEQNRLMMWRTVLFYLYTKIQVWSGNVALTEAIDELKAVIERAQAALSVQTSRSAGTTSERVVKSEGAIEKVLAVTRCAMAYALGTGDVVLLDAVRYTMTGLKHLPQNELIATLGNMLKATQAVARSLKDYGVTAKMFEEAEEAIRLVETHQTIARTSLSGKKAVTDSMPQIMAAGSLVLKKIDCMTHMVAAGDAEKGLRADREHHIGRLPPRLARR